MTNKTYRELSGMTSAGLVQYIDDLQLKVAHQAGYIEASDKAQDILHARIREQNEVIAELQAMVQRAVARVA